MMQKPKDIENYAEEIPTYNNSFNWKLFHGINYAIGGSTFVIGSYMYYPSVNLIYDGYTIGAWLYTIGSFCFLVADLTEWDHYRPNCQKRYLEENINWENTRKNEVAFNFFLSAIGSFLYLLGSIFFIPSLDMLLLGENLFIYGSLIIFFSQSWKCTRSAICGKKGLVENIKEDLSGFMVDLFAGIGGLAYAYGTYLFKAMITEQEQNIATNYFVFGGASFLISGIFMQYRYFLEKH